MMKVFTNDNVLNLDYTKFQMLIFLLVKSALLL